MTNPSTNPVAKAQTKTERAENGAPEMITLEQLALEVGISPRDARMLLRLAAKQTKQYPNLGKDHLARQPWQWVPGSKGLEEARKALATAQPA
jgi:hypothetical protein